MSEGEAAGGSAVLVIRVWREADTPNPFRARILYEGAADAPPRSVPASDPREVVAAVRDWLAEHS